MENRRNIWRKFVECSSSFWYSYPFGLRALILNWSNSRKYLLGEDWLCSSKKNGSGFGQSSGSVFEKICHRFKGNPSPILRKSVTDFVGNPSPTLRKTATDFAEISHRLWENQPPTLGKSATDFGKISHRLGENLPQTLGKSATDFGKNHRFCEAPFLGKTGSVFRKNMLRFWDEQAPFLGQSGSVLVKTGAVWGKNWLGFWIGSDKAQVSLFWTLSMFGFGFRILLKLGVSKNKSTSGKLEG